MAWQPIVHRFDGYPPSAVMAKNIPESSKQEVYYIQTAVFCDAHALLKNDPFIFRGIFQTIAE
jgi:hypothetical protein